MKKIISLICMMCIIVSNITSYANHGTCSYLMTKTRLSQSSKLSSDNTNEPKYRISNNIEDVLTAEKNLDLSDEDLQAFLRDRIYLETLNSLDSDKYCIENIETSYLSKEYLDQLEYNSKTNIYFGFTQAELDNLFKDKKYVFYLDDSNQTGVKEIESYTDTSSEDFIKNVAVGSGVILVGLTISVATAGTAPAISMIFAVGAKTGATMALSGAYIGGISAAIVEGYQTGNFKQALKVGAVGASDSFKWGAIIGTAIGGLSEGVALHLASKTSKLTIDQIAIIQRESKYPLSLIARFHSMDEYKLFKNLGLRTEMINGKIALIQDIDLNFVDDLGRTNLERMAKGLAPLDPNGVPYELHHITRKIDSPLAILTEPQHRSKDTYKILHDLAKDVVTDNPSSDPRWPKIKKEFWKAMASHFTKGV